MIGRLYEKRILFFLPFRSLKAGFLLDESGYGRSYARGVSGMYAAALLGRATVSIGLWVVGILYRLSFFWIVLGFFVCEKKRNVL
jgi:hypothetical protein